MPAYFIADQLEITDPETMNLYRSKVAATVEQYGGKFLVRGGNPQTIEGVWSGKSIIILEFRDRDAVLAWYHSDEYADLKTMRIASSKANIIIVDGV